MDSIIAPSPIQPQIPRQPASPGSTPGPTGPAPDPRALLAHVPAHRRSPLANWFHFSARSGATTPHAVCSGVWQTVQRRLQWASTPETRQFLQSVLDMLQTHQAEALAYAQHVLTYEALPYEQRQRVKAQRALQYLKTSMRSKPATEAQARYLRSLGYTGELPTDRGQASALIDALQQKGGSA
jgi:hypothetical protein